MSWMEGFLLRCLVGVPKGAYRDRVRSELRDHLAALEQELEAAGHSPGEARAVAKTRMGDPAELARRYAWEWKRRSWPCRLFTTEFLLLGLCMSGAGVLYIINLDSFGMLVDYWGFGAILASLLAFHELRAFFAGKRDLIGFCSWFIGVLQLPPLFCWAFAPLMSLLLSIPIRWWTFEMSGVMVPGWAGFSVHLLFLVWSVANYRWYAGYERETAGLWSVI